MEATPPDRPRTEYRVLMARVQSILGDSSPRVDLGSDALEFVAEKAGIQRDRIRVLAHALRLERDTAGVVDAEIFYGLLRSGHDGDLPELAELPIGVQRRRQRQRTAVEQNIISVTFEAEVEMIVAGLRDRIVAGALPKQGRVSIGAALAHSLSGTGVRSAFLARWLKHTGSPGEFLSSLREDPGRARVQLVAASSTRWPSNRRLPDRTTPVAHTTAGSE